MIARTGKLPRGPHASRVRPGEVVRKRGGADLQNGWLARHGELKITDERLLFEPTILDRLIGAKRREIPLGAVEEVERWPLRPDDFPPGGRRPRMLVHTETTSYQFLVGDLDAWIDAIVRVYDLRARDGLAHAPLIRREGYSDMLYSGD